MKKHIVFIFIVLTLLAFLVRFYKVGEVPNGVNGDEAAFGYNAYSILKTGKDEHGVWFPIISMQSFGDYKATFYSYAAIPGITIGGLTPLTTRLPAVILGAFTSGLMFLFVRKLTRSTFAGVVGGLLTALSPWHVYISRTAHESVLGLFFLVLGMWFFLAFGKRAIWWAFLSIIASSFSYNGTRLFPYVLFALTLLLARSSLKLSMQHLAGIGIVMIVMVFALMGGQVRFTQTTEGILKGSTAHIEEERKNCEAILPSTTCGVLMNKVTITPWIYMREIVSHYSLPDLFVKGIGDGGPYNLFHFGLFYLLEAPFFIIGLTQLYRLHPTFRWVILFWFLLSPLSSAATTYGNAGRMLIMLPAMLVTTTLGWKTIYDVCARFRLLFARLFVTMSVFALGWSSIQFAGNYAVNVKKFAGRDFRDGFQRIVPTVASFAPQYDTVYFSRYFDVQPYIFVAFYNQLDPRLVQQAWNDPLDGDGRITKLGKVHFFTALPPKPDVDDRDLLVVHAHEFSPKNKNDALATTLNNEGKEQFHVIEGSIWKKIE